MNSCLKGRTYKPIQKLEFCDKDDTSRTHGQLWRLLHVTASRVSSLLNLSAIPQYYSTQLGDAVSLSRGQVRSFLPDILLSIDDSACLAVLTRGVRIPVKYY